MKDKKIYNNEINLTNKTIKKVVSNQQIEKLWINYLISKKKNMNY